MSSTATTSLDIRTGLSPTTAPVATVEPDPSALLAQVACLGELDPKLVQRVRHEVLTAASGWKAEYGEFQSGGWWTLSLFNASGNAGDVRIGDCEAVETELLAKMPAARALLRGMGLRYMWVRVARLSGNSFLWEHRDYAELNTVERHRLHIPLQSNSSANLVISGTEVHLATERLWRLTPTFAHGVANWLGPDRIHLIIDCYADDRLAELTAGQFVPADGLRVLPALTTADAEKQLSVARTLARAGYVPEAERHLLRTFFKFSGPEGASYDLVVQLHEQLDDREAADDWRSKKDVMLARVDAGRESK